jgi:hypothetical protein
MAQVAVPSVEGVARSTAAGVSQGHDDDGVRILLAAADDYVLGRLGAEALPMTAAQALARDVDSPALRELAGLGRTETREAHDLFAQTMVELGHPLRDRRVVLWDRAGQVAGAVLAGGVGAAEAAGEIAALLCAAEHLDQRGRRCDFATRFELLVVDWDDMPERRGEIAEAIRSAARELLELVS